MRALSGLQRKPSRIPNSSSLTQSDVPLMTSSVPSVVSARTRAVGQILDVDVVLDDVGGHAAVGRELGEHERRGLEARTELAEPARGQIVRPEIAPGVLPPDPAGIGHDDQDLAVGRPGVILDGDGLRRSRRHEPGRRHEDLALAALGPVEDEIAAGPAAVGRLQGRVRIAVRHPTRRAEPLGREITRGEDPVQREQPGVGRCVLRGCVSGDQDEGRGPEQREAVNSGSHDRISPSSPAYFQGYSR